MTRIVTTAYRPKRPPRKRKVAIAGSAIVRKRSVEAGDQLPQQPANDDRKPAIVTTTSRKRARLMRAERAGRIGVL